MKRRFKNIKVLDTTTYYQICVPPIPDKEEAECILSLLKNGGCMNGDMLEKKVDVERDNVINIGHRLK